MASEVVQGQTNNKGGHVIKADKRLSVARKMSYTS